MSYRSCLAPALALVGALLLRVDAASACDPDPCFDADLWETLEPVNAALIPSDGVLVLQGSNRGFAPDWVDDVTLEVTLGGIPVDGALEAPGMDGVLVWRPAAPLQPGVHAVKGALNNPDELEYCSPDLVLDFEFTAEAGPAVALTPPTVTAMESVSVTPADSLTALVCCEGVVPETLYNDCGDGGPDYPAGGCGRKEGTGWLEVQLPIAPMLPVGTAGLLAFTLKVDGVAGNSTLSPQLSWRASAPFCTEVVATNLASGEEVTTAKQCHGDTVADQLGAQVLDPTLEITCTEPLQTCELGELDEAWDPAKCTPWPGSGEETGTPTEGSASAGSEGSGGTSEASESAGEQDPEGKGCGCVGGEAPGWSALGLLGLAALRRRRARG
ncbi:MAG: hypothetical protein JNK56_37185 [Myxococcales bacterium]|nr:hypothetical protein [Myxococcales bacterium]